MKKVCRVLVVVLLTIIMGLLVFLLNACTFEEKVTLKEDKTFYIDYSGSTILGLPLSTIAKETSHITLRSDGTATMTLEIKPAINYLLAQFNVLETIEGVDIDEMLWYLPSVFFPDNSIAQLENLLIAARASIGLSINGIDFQDPEMQPIFDELARTGKMPKGFSLPEELSVSYSANYHIVELESYDSGKYTAVYMGSHEENGEPYMVLTLLENEIGEMQISFTIDIVQFSVLATEKAS